MDQDGQKLTGCVARIKNFDEKTMRPAFIHNYNKKEQKAQRNFFAEINKRGQTIEEDFMKIQAGLQLQLKKNISESLDKGEEGKAALSEGSLPLKGGSSIM